MKTVKRQHVNSHKQITEKRRTLYRAGKYNRHEYREIRKEAKGRTYDNLT